MAKRTTDSLRGSPYGRAMVGKSEIRYFNATGVNHTNGVAPRIRTSDSERIVFVPGGVYRAERFPHIERLRQRLAAGEFTNKKMASGEAR